MSKRPPSSKRRSRRRQTHTAGHRLRRGTVERTYLAAGNRSPWIHDLVLDQQIRNAFLYTVALHAKNRPIAIHDARLVGPSYRIVFTTRDPGARDGFVQSVARDFSGFLREHTGDRELSFKPERPIPLDDVESQLRATELRATRD